MKMFLALCLLAVASAKQITQFTIDYGSFLVPGTMVEDEDTVTFTGGSGETRINTLVVNYRTMTLIVKKERQSICYVTTLTHEMQTKLEAYRNLILTRKPVPAALITYTVERIKPGSQSPMEKQFVKEQCANYSTQYANFVVKDPQHASHRVNTIEDGPIIVIVVG